MSYCIKRGYNTRKQDNWLVQPGPVIYRTPWDVFAAVVTGLSIAVCGGMAVLLAVRILQGMG